MSSLKEIVKGHQALIHPSCLNEDTRIYERFEFLGDRVLGLCMARLLLERFSDYTEGEIVRIFNTLVSKSVMYEISQNKKLFDFFSIGNIKLSHAILTSMYEVVLGIVFEEKGLDFCQDLVKQDWEFWLKNPEGIPQDYKTLLQEYAAKHNMGAPKYATLNRIGPDHQPTFCAEVYVEGLGRSQGQGGSKRAAESEAVRRLCEQHQIKL